MMDEACPFGMSRRSRMQEVNSGKHARMCENGRRKPLPGNPDDPLIVVHLHQPPRCGVGVGPYHQGRRGVTSPMEGDDGFKVDFHEGVAVQHEDRLAVEAALDLFERPTGAQQHPLVRVGDAHAVFRSIAERLLDHRGEIVQVDDDVANSVTPQEQQIPDNERRAPHG